MAAVRVSTKGQIVIPADVRRELGITPGTYVAVSRRGKSVELTPIGDDLLAATRGMFKESGMSTDDLLADRAEDLALEERKVQRWLTRSRSRKTGA